MPVIGVIGANGQVGSEVCLHLSRMPEVRVVPICRTLFGSLFLRRCGLESRQGVLNEHTASELLRGCDLVADFSLPQGRPSAVRAAIKTTLTWAIRGGEPGSRFVYISSIVAYGMGSASETTRNHWLARTAYGASKRYAESLAFRLGWSFGREVYVLRLGQVHGELQSATRNIRREFRNETTYVPAGASYTVFAFTIAEALVRISEGHEQPGRYTLVSVPAWTWKEIHEFYCLELGAKIEVVEYQNDESCFRHIGRKTRSLLKSLTLDPALRFAERHREVIAGSLLFAVPNLEARAATTRLVRRAGAEISLASSATQHRPYQPYRGVVPGRRLRSLSDSRLTMDRVARQVREILRNTTQRLDETHSRGDIDP